MSVKSGGKTGAELGMLRLLERHETARRRGVPTLTVIEKKALAVVERIWGVRSMIAVGDIEELMARLSSLVDLRSTAAQVIATVLGRDSSDVAVALETAGKPELEAMLASYSARERRRGVARVIGSISAGESLDGEALGPLVRVIDEPPIVIADELELGCALVFAAPELPVVVATSAEDVERFLAERDDRAAALVREGWIAMPRAPTPTPTPVSDVITAAHEGALARYRQLVAGELDAEGARSAAEALLFARLEARPPTAGVFRLNERMDFAFGPRPAEIDLYSRRHALAVEVDGYYHFTDSAAYRRDRRKDALLQRYEIFVLRFLADDVLEQLEEVVASIVDVMRWRDQGGRSGGD